MYLIKHIKNCSYYKSKIAKNMNHYVFNKNEARRFKSKSEAQKFLETFNHKENYEIVKI